MTCTITTPEITTDNIIGKPHNVILFNNDNHTTDEVSRQIMKATSCGAERAFQIMMEAHKNGRAIVFSGGLEKCEHVEAILSDIRLGTKIEQA